MVVEHRGYEISQAENHHIMIVKDGEFCAHSQCTDPMTEEELREMVDRYIELVERMSDHAKRNSYRL